MADTNGEWHTNGEWLLWYELYGPPTEDEKEKGPRMIQLTLVQLRRAEHKAFEAGFRAGVNQRARYSPPRRAEQITAAIKATWQAWIINKIHSDSD